MITDVIILEGGFGERLWSELSLSHPKQFLALNDNHSFLQNGIQLALDEFIKVYESVPSKAIAEKTSYAVAVKANFD